MQDNILWHVHETIRRIQHIEEIKRDHRIRSENASEHYGDDHIHVHGLEYGVGSSFVEYGVRSDHVGLLRVISHNRRALVRQYRQSMAFARAHAHRHAHYELRRHSWRSRFRSSAHSRREQDTAQERVRHCHYCSRLFYRVCSGKSRSGSVIVLCFIHVLVNTGFKGTTIGPIVKYFKVKRKETEEPTMSAKLTNRLIDHVMSCLEDIAGVNGKHSLRDK